MLKSKFEGETMVFKNDKGFYSTSISQKKIDGSYENGYFSLNFKKGVDIPNKTKINVKNGWLKFYKYQNKSTGKEDTSWQIFVNDFDIVGNNSTPVKAKAQQDDFIADDSDDLPF